MKNNVSEIVKKTLNEKYEIDSKFNLILENESLSEKQKFNQALDFICELEESGKSREEIEEQFLGSVGDWFSKYLKPGADDTSSKTGLSTDPDNNVQKFGSAAASQLRTYLITQGLGLMGFKGRLAKSVAIVMADLDFRYLVAMFRGGKNCEVYAPPVIDAVTEGMARYLMYDIEEDSYIGGYFSETIFEYFRASQLGEDLAKVLCRYIPKR